MLSTRKFLGSGLLIAVLLVSTGCDSLLATLRGGYAASRPFIQSLVDSNTIPQNTANLALADVEDSINALSKGDQCLKSITETGSAKKIAKAKCYYEAAKTLRTILDRHHFDGNDLLNRIETIAEGAIAALEEYYKSVSSPPSTSPSASRRPVDPDAAERLLKAKMNEAQRQMKDLKRQLERK